MSLDHQSPYFLDVDSSATGRPWLPRVDATATRVALAISQRTDISEILARIIAARGVGVDEASVYLQPTIRALMPDPSTIADMDVAAERLAAAILRRETVALFGDYDVDGACACALVARYLRHFGIVAHTYIPDRVFEGYGPSVGAMDQLIDSGATLILTLDCGTLSEGPISHARRRGAEVLVVDHHLADADLPPAMAIINPNRPDDVSGLGYLCATGVAFMVLVATNRVLRERGDAGLPDLMALIDLVGLATVCDVVPLRGLNRAFVQRGLEVAQRGTNKGIAALALAARLSGPMQAYHLGFLIGPRINAGGRIGNAALGAQLLATEDEHEALMLAARLDELNGERQSIEKVALEEAYAAAEAEIGAGAGPSILFLASAHWHPGIVGLVAARLRERFDRPAFAIALGPDGTGTGSGRSLPGVDIGSAVIEAVDQGLIARGGGHAMAAGVTIRPGQMAAFRAHMTERLDAAVAAARARQSLRIDAALSARAASPDFVRDIDRAGPFGAGNPQPVFVFPAHRAKFVDIAAPGGHVRFTLVSGDGARLGAVAFRAAETSLGQAILGVGDTPLHVAGTLTLEHWQGRERASLRVTDVAAPAST